MSDKELEALCKLKPEGFTHTFNWTSEVYSFGKCFRYLANYPSVFPLFIYSDHGVPLDSFIYPHELNNKSRIHFTWNPHKENRYANIKDRAIIRVPHPWINYRKKKNISLAESRKGTIVFFAHSTPDVRWENHDSKEYFEQLNSLPEKFQPVTICMHMHDINAGHHKKLRQYGIPIVTIGNVYSPYFIDRFYQLTREFSFATSHSWGSQVAYCIEFGIPYFFMGNTPRLINIGDKELPIGLVAQYHDSYHEELAKKAETLFRTPVDSITKEQKAFISSLLGLDSDINQSNIKGIIWTEFFINWKNWYLILVSIIVRCLSIIGVYEILKKARKYLININ
jgi:hypothetical protein